MLKFLLTTVLSVSIMGCAGVKPYIGPDGEPLYVVKCKFDESQCFNDAAKTCNGPYSIKSTARSTGGLLADALPGPVTWYKMMYACGIGDSVRPNFPHDGRPIVIPQPPVQTRCVNSVGGITCISQ